MAGLEKEIDPKVLDKIDFLTSQTERQRERSQAKEARRAWLDDYINKTKDQHIMNSTQYADYMSKVRDRQAAGMADMIIRSRRGVGYKPNLTHADGVYNFLLNNPGYDYIAGDFDDDIRTPKNVIVLDERGQPAYIDGYYIRNDNEKRTIDAKLGTYKTKRAYKTMGKLEKRLFNQYVKDNWDREEISNEGFKNWAQVYLAKHPNVGTKTGMHYMQKEISDKIKEVLSDVGLEPKDIRFIELQSHIIGNLIEQTKKLYGIAKLKSKEHWDTVEHAFNAITDNEWKALIQRYAIEGEGLGFNIADYYDTEAKRDYNFGKSFGRGAYKGANRGVPINVLGAESMVVPAHAELNYSSPIRSSWGGPSFRQWGDTPLGPSEKTPVFPRTLISPEGGDKEK
jgi:hypothetical protein